MNTSNDERKIPESESIDNSGNHNRFLILTIIVIVLAVSSIVALFIWRPWATRGEVTESVETSESIYISETEPMTESIIESTEITLEKTTEEATEETTEEAISSESTEEPRVEIDPDDLEMLACVIYREAGGDACCDECRKRVADVVLNRVNDDRFPNTIYEVLTQESQYGKMHWTGIVWPERAQYDGEQKAVARAYRIAEEVLSGQHSDLYGAGYIWQANFIQGSDNVYCCGMYYGR